PVTIARDKSHAVVLDRTTALRRQPVCRPAAGQRAQPGGLAGRVGGVRLPAADPAAAPAGGRAGRAALRDSLGASLGPGADPAHGRLRLAVLPAGQRHWLAGGALRPLLHVAEGSGAALLLLPAGLHGRH